jgi:hypothetical protein
LFAAAYQSVGFTWSEGDVMALSGSFAADRSSWPTKEHVIHFTNDRPEDIGSVFSRAPTNALWLNLSTRPREPLLHVEPNYDDPMFTRPTALAAFATYRTCRQRS